MFTQNLPQLPFYPRDAYMHSMVFAVTMCLAVMPVLCSNG